MSSIQSNRHLRKNVSVYNKTGVDSHQSSLDEFFFVVHFGVKFVEVSDQFMLVERNARCNI